MKLALSVIAALLTFFAADQAVQMLGRLAGVPAHVSYNTPIVLEGYDQEYESYGSTTTFGYLASVFAVVVAVWCSRAVYFGSLHADFTRRGRQQFIAWLAGLVTLLPVVVGTHLFFTNVRFPFKGHVWFVVDLAACAGVAWIRDPYVRWCGREGP